MRHAALLAKTASGDATSLAAHRVLRMATLDGAAALGLDDSLGSLMPGKWADLCTVRLNDWITQPCYDPASHLVYVAGREQVSHVWVAGQLRLHDGLPVGPGAEKLNEIANSWHNLKSMPCPVGSLAD
jgi:5-methylthioadenosine/S-adenosylhomocysteine deaminase